MAWRTGRTFYWCVGMKKGNVYCVTVWNQFQFGFGSFYTPRISIDVPWMNIPRPNDLVFPLYIK